MNMRLLILASLIAAAQAHSACRPAGVIRDWALHRQWAIQPDRSAPGKPARLVEVPWDSPAAPDCAAQGQDRRSSSAAVVRAGSRVMVMQRDEYAALQLSGIALESGRMGQTIRIRAGLSGALWGIVRAPGVIELQAEKGRK